MCYTKNNKRCQNNREGGEEMPVQTLVNKNNAYLKGIIVSPFVFAFSVLDKIYLTPSKITFYNITITIKEELICYIHQETIKIWILGKKHWFLTAS